MKTLLKNRRTYRNRIGAPDDDHATMKNEGSDDEDPHDGNNTDSWDEMYQTDKEGDNGEDKGDNVEDGDEEGGDGIKDGDEEGGADNEDEVNLEISGSRDGGGDEGGSEDGDRNNGKEGYGSCSVSGRKDDEGRNGMKRKNRDDEPVTRAKRTKRDVSGGHQATQPMKKLLLRKKSGKK